MGNTCLFVLDFHSTLLIGLWIITMFCRTAGDPCPASDVWPSAGHWLGELLYPIEEEGYSDCVSCLVLNVCVKKVKCEKLCVLISICSRCCQSRRGL